jgi:hypothetical protein
MQFCFIVLVHETHQHTHCSHQCTSCPYSWQADQPSDWCALAGLVALAALRQAFAEVETEWSILRSTSWALACMWGDVLSDRCATSCHVMLECVPWATVGMW